MLSRPRRAPRQAVCLLVLISCLWCAASASAKAREYPFLGTDPASTLTPAASGSTRVRTMSAQDYLIARYNISVPGNGWARIRNEPTGFVVGNIQNGGTIDVSRLNSTNTWMFGYAFGSYNACGWVYAPNTRNASSAPSTNGCAGQTSFGLPTFASGYNGCNGDGCDGTLVPAGITCDPVPMYANSGGRTLTNNWANPYHVRDFRWRYVTRDGAWIMGRDPYQPDDGTANNWVFIPRSCMPSLPGYQAVS